MDNSSELFRVAEELTNPGCKVPLIEHSQILCQNIPDHFSAKIKKLRENVPLVDVEEE